MEKDNPVFVSSIKAAMIATLAGGSITTLLAAMGGHEEVMEFVKTYGVPMAMVIFFVWAGWTMFVKLGDKHDSLQREFREVLKNQIAESNQLHRDTNSILVEQNKMLKDQGESLITQSQYLREMAAKLNMSGAIKTIQKDV